MSHSDDAVEGTRAPSDDKSDSAPGDEPPDILLDAIQREIIQRRRNLGGKKPLSDNDPIWGLALSGGGVRSATFSFGVLRALASRRLLLRFDLLSTVSGGGYIGTTVGSLFHRASNGDEARAVQESIDGQFPSFNGGRNPGGEKSTSWFLWWLRANGRYLIPRGVKDTTFAAALYFRNLVGIHFELGLMAILIGLMLSGVDLVVWWLLEQLGYQFANSGFFNLLRWIPNWLPTISLLLPFLALSAARLGIAYWTVPWVQAHAHGVSAGSRDTAAASPATNAGAKHAPASPKVKTPWLILVGVLFTDIVLSFLFFQYGTTSTGFGNVVRNVLWWSCAALIALWVVGAYTAQCQLLKVRDSASAALQADKARNVLTKRFAIRLRWMMAAVLAGMIDRVAWFLAFDQISIVDVGLTLALAAAVLRGLMPLVTAFAARDGKGASAVLALGRAGGYLLVFLLASWWVALVYEAVLGALFTGKSLDYAGGWLVLGLIAVPVFGYTLITGRNLSFLNLSSLHSFYRARLVRSYMGAANASRFGASGKLGALSPVTAQMPTGQEGSSIDQVMPGDDISLTRYRPQASGGPIHLINVCVNQTQDPRGRIFNQDRLGLSLTLASGGLMRASLGEWTQLTESSGMSVGRWMAISGAAVAPGMGFQTRGGLAALMTFAGVRLGYWWREEEREMARVRAKTDLFAKSKGLAAEVFGTFKGTAGPDWFLTDGGHFENTGAYALLAQRANVIVVVDGGADPQYKFDDLENLVRIARVDLHADVQFLRRKSTFSVGSAGGLPDELRFFGSINDLASKNGTACLALARVVYGGEKAGTGILILIKPNICDGLPVDLMNFKAQYPDFPQQSTADQFFSESQWESYFLLGQYLGGKLTREFIERLLTSSDEFFESDDCSTSNQVKEETKLKPLVTAKAQKANSRLPSRITQSAVGTTLGLGVVATAAISTWQAIDGVRTSYAKKTETERAALKELTDLWAKVPPTVFAAENPREASLALSNLAAAIVRSADTLCPANEATWYINSPLATQITRDAINRCENLMEQSSGVPASAGPPCYMLVRASNPDLKSPLPQCLSRTPQVAQSVPPPLYWGYDYSATRNVDYWHPCEPLRAPVLDAERQYNARFVQRGEETGTLPPVSNAPPNGCRDITQGWLNVWDSLRNDLSGRFVTASRVIWMTLATRAESDTQSQGSAGQVHVPQDSVRASSSQVPSAEAPVPSVGSGNQTTSEMGHKTNLEGLPVLPSCVNEGTRKEAAVLSSSEVCKGIRVFIQTYGASQHPQLICQQRRWEELLAAKPQPIEDVVETASRRNRLAPAPVRQNEIRYHGSDSKPCAMEINKTTGNAFIVKPLGAQFTPTRRTLEVWVAPPTSATDGH